MKFSTRLLIILFVISLNAGCDQVTKKIAYDYLKNEKTVQVIGEYFVLTPALNKGAFLSFGTNFPGPLKAFLLVIFPVMSLLGITLYIIFSKQLTLLQTITFSCIIGGGGANVFDRILKGSVFDFMHFHIGPIPTGILNFADLSITFGVIVLFFSFALHKKEEVKTEPEPPENPL